MRLLLCCICMWATIERDDRQAYAKPASPVDCCFSLCLSIEFDVVQNKKKHIFLNLMHISQLMRTACVVSMWMVKIAGKRTEEPQCWTGVRAIHTNRTRIVWDTSKLGTAFEEHQILRLIHQPHAYTPHTLILPYVLSHILRQHTHRQSLRSKHAAKSSTARDTEWLSYRGASATDWLYYNSLYDDVCEIRMSRAAQQQQKLYSITQKSTVAHVCRHLHTLTHAPHNYRHLMNTHNAWICRHARPLNIRAREHTLTRWIIQQQNIITSWSHIFFPFAASVHSDCLSPEPEPESRFTLGILKSCSLFVFLICSFFWRFGNQAFWMDLQILNIFYARSGRGPLTTFDSILIANAWLLWIFSTHFCQSLEFAHFFVRFSIHCLCFFLILYCRHNLFSTHNKPIWIVNNRTFTHLLT